MVDLGQKKVEISTFFYARYSVKIEAALKAFPGQPEV